MPEAERAHRGAAGVIHDVIVCGAGPAGSVVAQRLAAAGARVALVGMPSRPGWEGLSARSLALLAEEGLDLDDLIAGPFARRGTWGNGRVVEGREWLMDRAQLAEALRHRAVAAGALPWLDMVTGARRTAHHWQVCLRGGDVLRAPVLIDARGRHGAQRRGPVLLAYGQGFRRKERGLPKAREMGRAGGRAGAWVEVGPSTGTNADTDADSSIGTGIGPTGSQVRTRVEAGAGMDAASEVGTGIGVAGDGWCWWAARRDALWVQVVGRPGSRHPAKWIAAAAAQIPPLARALEDASIEGHAVARPAHARLGMTAHDATLWQVGDAALALDPLSGQGIYEALRGARLTATAIQSVFDGGDAGLAQRFIGERREEAWRHGVGAALGFYQENFRRGAFWADTAAEYAALLAAGAPVQLDNAEAAAPLAVGMPVRPESAQVVTLLRGDEQGSALSVEGVEAAVPSVGGMRRAVTAGSMQAGVRIERRPVLEHGRIREKEVIVTAENPRGLWHVDGVPLVALKTYLDAAERATVVGAALALDRPPSSVASAIHWLQKAGAVLRPIPPSHSLGG